MFAWRLKSKKLARSSPPTEEADTHWALSAGERMTPVPRRRRGGRVMLGLLALLLAAGGTWTAFGDRSLVETAGWPEWARTGLATLAKTATNAFEQHWRGVTERPADAAVSAAGNAEPTQKLTTAALSAPALPPPRPAPVEEVKAVPSAEPATTPSVVVAPVSQAAAPSEAPQAAPEPLPKPVATEAYQKRAEAVGLHPDLSKVLLERMSATDYRHADVAIRTALSETPEGGVHIWPRPRRPDFALFEVRFVPGAPAGCRRYVVNVLKDGWSTTAMPMEKCGVKPPPAPIVAAAPPAAKPKGTSEKSAVEVRNLDKLPMQPSAQRAESQRSQEQRFDAKPPRLQRAQVQERGTPEPSPISQ